jgi:phosphoenolpyruvate carboxykinase (ATP)
VGGVPKGILNPRESWLEKEAYDAYARKLADLFKENFEKFEGEVDPEVRLAGPR